MNTWVNGASQFINLEELEQIINKYLNIEDEKREYISAYILPEEYRRENKSRIREHPVQDKGNLTKRGKADDAH